MRTILPSSSLCLSYSAHLGSWQPCPCGQLRPGPHRVCLLSRPCCTPSHRGRTHCTGAACGSGQCTACQEASEDIKRKKIGCKVSLYCVESTESTT